MKIAFHSNQLGTRGTEVALFDYAKYNIELLGNQSVVFSPRKSNHSNEVIEKFKTICEVIFYDSLLDLEELLSKHKVEIFYTIKAGYNDGLLPKNVRNCVHVVFKHQDVHGDRYAYVSEWLSEEMSNKKIPFVPHIVELPNTNLDLRELYGIKKTDLVFGRYGGSDTFDLHFAKRAVYKIAKENPQIHFLFMNTNNFLENKDFFRKKLLNKLLSPFLYPQKEMSNIHFLKPTVDLIEKSIFINTCDAMIHARSQGESFGIAVGEFSIKNKPVFTCDSSKIKERSHINILGNKGFYYQNYASLIDKILSFKRVTNVNYDAYSGFFNKEAVMQKFKEVFID